VYSLNGANVELKEVWKNFDGQPHIFLATAEGGQPRVRPVTLIHLHDKLFVATGSSDPKVKQMKQNPRTEFCLLLEESGRKGTIRAECMVQIVEDKDVKADVYSNVSFAKEFWTSSEDPNYALIELQPTSLEYMKPGSVQSIKMKL
jgi:uncharacterized pyridoxamine 5'-phosphate oxidase family protein